MAHFCIVKLKAIDSHKEKDVSSLGGVLMDLIQNIRGDSWVTRMLDAFGSGDGASESKSKPSSPRRSAHYIIQGGLSTCIIITAHEKQAQKNSLTLR